MADKNKKGDKKKKKKRKYKKRMGIVVVMIMVIMIALLLIIVKMILKNNKLITVKPKEVLEDCNNSRGMNGLAVIVVYCPDENIFQQI